MKETAWKDLLLLWSVKKENVLSWPGFVWVRTAKIGRKTW